MNDSISFYKRHIHTQQFEGKETATGAGSIAFRATTCECIERVLTQTPVSVRELTGLVNKSRPGRAISESHIEHMLRSYMLPLGVVVQVNGIRPFLYHAPPRKPEYASSFEELPKQHEPAQAVPVEPSMAPDPSGQSTALAVFDFKGHSVRVVSKDGSEWWVAKDVCEVLGYDTKHISMALDRLDEDENHTVVLADSAGRNQEVRAVNESGLYSLVLTSRKPEAKAFKKWVTSEVLPQLRRTGSYTVSGAALVTPAELESIVRRAAHAELAVITVPIRRKLAEVLRGVKALDKMTENWPSEPTQMQLPQFEEVSR